MNTLTQNAPIALNIAAIAIHQDAEGRYSLNDLHKASGYNDKDRPSIWLENAKTKNLIKEIEKMETGIPASKAGISAISVIHGGAFSGTYVVKELVYAYAMWISPSFMLKVIRTFDAVQSGLSVVRLNIADEIKADKYIHDLAQQYQATKDAWRRETLRDSLIRFCAMANKPLHSFDLVGIEFDQHTVPGLEGRES